ncbi:hypothetical protein BOX15_Mlig003909g1, partial [Macrostomum lignano]
VYNKPIMPGGPAKRMKLLLPIKTSHGQLIAQSREEAIEDHQAVDDNVESDAESNVASGSDEGIDLMPDSDADELIDHNETAGQDLTPVEQMALEESKAKEMRINIANHAQTVMDNPQENVGHLRKLRLLLADPLCQARPLLADYIVVSLCEVFKDILPSYKIRLATDTEKSQLAKKETKRLRAFEETLLLNYRKYLALLRQAMCKQQATNSSKTAKDKKLSGWRRKRKRVAEKDEAELAYSNRNVAIRCLSQLLANHPNFNESSELIAWLTPCLQSRSAEISSLACSAFRQLFVEDRAGEASLRAVKAACRVAVAAGAKVHADLLDVLTSVRLDLPPPTKDQSAPGNQRLTHQQKLAKLSRKERRQGKRSADATRGLEELRHQESAATRARLQQRCAELLLHLYLRVLRAKPGARALTSALTGLARLSLRVNLDLLPDLFSALQALLDWPDLSTAHSVEVVRTALALLSGEGEALTLDPRRFYLHLYKRLPRLVRHHPDLAPSLSQTLLAALADRRRHLPPMRPVNFLRRLLDSICQTALLNGNGSSATEASLTCLLTCAARLLAVFPRAQRLLEPADDVDDAEAAATAAGQLVLATDDDPDLGGLSCQSCEPLLRKLASGSNQVASHSIRQLASLLLKQNFSAIHAASAGGRGGDLSLGRAPADNCDDDEEHDDQVEKSSTARSGRQSKFSKKARQQRGNNSKQKQQQKFGSKKSSVRKKISGGGRGGSRGGKRRR